MYKKYREITLAQTFLELDRNGVPAPRRLKVCVALLLFQMARADGAMSRAEFQEIIRGLNSEFHEVGQASVKYLDAAALLATEEAHFDQFIGDLNRAFDSEQREHLFDMLIKVAQADGTIRESEKFLALRLREKLNLPLR